MSSSDQKFRYKTIDGVERQLNISLLHLAQAEMDVAVSLAEWGGRIEPQLVAAHKAWLDASGDNHEHFVVWCRNVVEVDGRRTYCTVEDGAPQQVPYSVLVDAERFFKKSFLQLSVLHTFNLKMFIVWKTLEPNGLDFYKWLANVDQNLECEVYSEGGNDVSPKG